VDGLWQEMALIVLIMADENLDTIEFVFILYVHLVMVDVEWQEGCGLTAKRSFAG